MTAYIKRTEKSQINYLMLHLKFLEKQEQAKPKTSRRRETIKIRPKLMKQKQTNKNHTKNQQNKKLVL
jgi:hypothetical protein